MEDSLQEVREREEREKELEDYLQKVRERNEREKVRLEKLAPVNGFAMRVCEARRCAGLTQKQLAERVGVSVRTIGEYEKVYDEFTTPIEKIPNHFPQLDIVIKIATVCNFPIVKLIPDSFLGCQTTLLHYLLEQYFRSYGGYDQGIDEQALDLKCKLGMAEYAVNLYAEERDKYEKRHRATG